MEEKRLKMIQVASGAMWTFFHGAESWPGHSTDRYSNDGRAIVCRQCSYAIKTCIDAVYNVFNNDDGLLTPKEVANAMRVDPKTVSRWCEDGKLDHIATPGGHYRIRRSTLDKMLEAGVEE